MRKINQYLKQWCLDIFHKIIFPIFPQELQDIL